MKNIPVIRTASVIDAPEVSRLLRSAMLTYCADSGISSSLLEAMTESVDSVADRILRQTCLIAVLDGKIIGTVCIKTVSNPLVYSFSDKTFDFLKTAGPSCYISRFAVAEEYRKTGIGIDLITWIACSGHRMGCHIPKSNRPWQKRASMCRPVLFNRTSMYLNRNTMQSLNPVFEKATLHLYVTVTLLLLFWTKAA